MVNDTLYGLYNVYNWNVTLNASTKLYGFLKPPSSFLKGKINAIRHVLYNCTVARPTIESSTKEASIEPGTETLSITADPREDGLVKSRTGDETTTATYNNWYKNVYVPSATTGGTGGSTSGT